MLKGGSITIAKLGDALTACHQIGTDLRSRSTFGKEERHLEKQRQDSLNKNFANMVHIPKPVKKRHDMNDLEI